MLLRSFVNLSPSPILNRFFSLLTPPSELPTLPRGVKGYLGIHLYTTVQIVVTLINLIITLTKGAPAFPIIIIALVPIRLLLMNKIWDRETLRFVDAWACRDGTPDDEIQSEKNNEKDPKTPSPPDVPHKKDISTA